ncbi:nicotinate phosphoribosyltransferase [Pseudonocardia halophobica]|uniref:Nicotinate phosphoribosyltransferase n=1 Tax=Pseudonocardia halophobica TaxID=29401 RepID=A0A9W6KXQ2_9PSEU|nr:nicotinate phosphoribosyltransferase [Pseudonocardia halophobica]
MTGTIDRRALDAGHTLVTPLTTTGASTALHTDAYEITMLRAALADGTAAHRATFEVFARRLPAGRRYGVVAGLGRLTEALQEFRFTAGQIAMLRAIGVADDATAAYLAEFAFTGNIDAYREGELYFPYSPVLTVSGTFGECVLLETLVLSILNADSAIATAAARMVTAAAGRPLIEMGSRRTHEEAAVAAARAAYLVGFTATSNLQAGLRHGVPVTGTSGHAFVLAHADERAGFAGQVAALGTGTTLLVDTYDTGAGIRTAIDVAGTDLGAIRIDSGDPAIEAARARTLLDSLDARGTRITVTGDLDEHRIAALADAPVDAFGVGTRLVTGAGAPTAEMIYKLVAIADAPGADAPLRPVAKRSVGKASIGGIKRASRELDDAGHAARERVVATPDLIGRTRPGRLLQVSVVRHGTVLHSPTPEEVRAHHRRAKTELLPRDLDLSPGTPRLTGAPAGRTP